MTETNGSGPGSRLKEARVAIDVNTREVADALNLPIDVIDAIEADAHDLLPAPVFTRGYIRAYAKLLDLEVEPLVASYSAPEVETSASLLMDEPTTLRLHRFVGPVIGGSVALVIIVILVVITVVWPSGEAPEADSDAAQASGVSTETSVVSPESTSTEDPASAAGEFVDADGSENADLLSSLEPSEASGLENFSAPSIDIASTTPGSIPGKSTGEAAAEDTGTATGPGIAPDITEDIAASAPATALSAAVPLATPATRTRRLTPAGDNRLMLAFTKECWVEVKNLDGSSLYSNLSRAGTELQLIGSGPFRVLLGYAPGATLAYNGETVPLTAHTRNNVASLMVGQ